jgi:hypothetical protein
MAGKNPVSKPSECFKQQGERSKWWFRYMDKHITNLLKLVVLPE